jgi:branched-chain amino acid transport system substrate-binding protein
VNEAGGVRGHRIRLEVEDDGYEPGPALRNTDDLIERKDVLFLFGYVGTPTLTRVLPLLELYKDRHIVNVAPFTGAQPQRRPPYDRYVFSVRASYNDETRALVDYLYGRGCRRFVFLGQADAYGKSGEVGTRQALLEHGLKLEGLATYRRNQRYGESMREQVEILKEIEPDAVIAAGTYEPCAAFIRDARMAGFNVPVANLSFVGADELLRLLKDESRRVGRDLTSGLVNSQVVPSPEAVRYPLVASYCRRVPDGRRGYISLEGWLDAVVATEGLRRTGKVVSRTGFVAGLESLDKWDPGLGVGLGFSRTRHVGLREVWLTEAQGGRWVEVSAARHSR